MRACHASRGERRREFPLLCCLEGTEAARPRALLFSHGEAVADHVCRLHVGRLRTNVHVLEQNVFNLVIELGSLVEETSSEFGVAGLLGEPQERGRLPEKIALARHSKHSWLRRKIRTKRGSYSPARHRAALLLQAPLADLERWQASSSSAKSRL